jgi:hypothetical protein
MPVQPEGLNHSRQRQSDGGHPLALARPRLDPDGDLTCCEEEAGAVEILEGRVDYTLRVKVTTEAQPVAVALIEPKRSICLLLTEWNRPSCMLSQSD